MRILAIADTPRDASSGAAGTDVQTIEALRRRGHEVVEVWADGLGRRIRHGNLHYLLEAPRTILRAVRSNLAAAPFDVVIASQPHGFRAARWVLRTHPETAFVNRTHGWEPHVEEVLAPHRRARRTPRWSGARAIVGSLIARRLDAHCTAMARDAAGIIVSSTACRDYIARRYGLEGTRIAVVPQAPPEAYRLRPVRPRTTRDTLRVLLVGSPAFVKGVPVALDVMRDLVAGRAKLSFTWVTDRPGLAPWVNESHAPVLRSTTWLSKVCQDGLMDVYDDHDIFLFPSYFEGFGKACLEAMSRGLCVVASDVGGMHDVVTSDHDGILCKPGDVDAYVAAIRRLADTPGLRTCLGSRARETALAYSWDRVAQDVEAFCDRLLAERQRGRARP